MTTRLTDAASRPRFNHRAGSLRISIRFLLILAAGVAIPLALLTKQWRVAAQLRGLDVAMTYRYQYDRWDEPSHYSLDTNASLPTSLRILGPDIASTVVSVRSVNSPNPALVAELTASLPHLRTVRIVDAPLVDNDLPFLTTLSGLRGLHLCGTSITDRSVETLSQLQGLMVLNLRDTELSENAIDTLRKSLPNTRVHAGERQGGHM